ncbi:NADP-dependent oxidoreductase [Pedobacter sp. MR2016-19]|uniref:NADP-dependent oxidoreductase n=1 Tax=Pedobacter sp. MR2016-19 TaxID=2780089 RepID=UPI001874324C|nr:NADP-dependent oxidoreductase [Pedobacter sp. MR2016-19]MBE5320782.1 NADP-dependent oxidoreductase [Pedobacter sp. MR2016-19]
MKAIRINEFGGPEVMKIEETERPVPAAGEILIKVYASGVNPVDWAIRNGTNQSLRSFLKLPITLGWDAAGIVEDVGSDVMAFSKGDEVYGVPDFPGDGSYAEYCVAKASRFALKPKSLNFNQASAVPLAALTGWTGMFEHGKLQPAQRILIQGASGGVGSFAVQFAKAKGAYVIGMASTANLDYVRQLGADEVIDYKTQKFEELLQDIDVVLEASPVRDNGERIKALSVLREGGIFVSVNTDFKFNDEMIATVNNKKVKAELALNQARQEWLTEMAALIDEGKVQVFIDKVFPFEQAAEAHRESETWHVRGKLVLEIRK